MDLREKKSAEAFYHDHGHEGRGSIIGNMFGYRMCELMYAMDNDVSRWNKLTFRFWDDNVDWLYDILDEFCEEFFELEANEEGCTYRQYVDMISGLEEDD